MVRFAHKELNFFKINCTIDLCKDRLRFGCWNMRTSVEADGPVATAVTRASARGVTVDRKAFFTVEEFRKFNVEVVGISETKWFGQDMYDVGSFLILHFGCPVTGAGEQVERNKDAYNLI